MCLTKVLDKSTINKRLIEAIKSFYKGSISKIKAGNYITEGFTVTKGLRAAVYHQLYLKFILKEH